MRYKAINELNHFSFEEAVISKMDIHTTDIRLELEALIVRPNNSQNTNYTESFAGTTQMRLVNGKILRAIREGYKYYDANDVLKKVVPDEELSEEQMQKIISQIGSRYMAGFVLLEKTENSFIYDLGIEQNDEDTYWFTIEFEKSITEWEIYMNRVQR